MSVAGRDSREPDWRERILTVRGSDGLHARPTIRFSREARGFAAKIQITDGDGGDWVDAKSVAKVMGLRLEAGRRIVLRATGVDAEAALTELGKLIECDAAPGDTDAK